MAIDDENTFSQRPVPGDYTPRRRSTYTPPATEPTANEIATIAEVSDQPGTAETAEQSEPDTPLVPPKRASLDAGTLETRLRTGLNDDDSHTLPLIEFVEQQIELREADIVAYNQWEEQMVQLGTAEALVAVQQARQEHPDLVTHQSEISAQQQASDSTEGVHDESVPDAIAEESYPDETVSEEFGGADPVGEEFDDERPANAEAIPEVVIDKDIEGSDTAVDEQIEEPSDSDDERAFFDDEFEQESEEDTREALIAGERGFVSDVVAEAFAELGIDDQYSNLPEPVAESDTESEATPGAESAPLLEAEPETESEAVADISTGTVDDSELHDEAEAESESQDSDASLAATPIEPDVPFSGFKLVEPEPVPSTDEDELEERVAQHTGETDYLSPDFVPEDDAEKLDGPRYTSYASAEFDAILGMTEDHIASISDDEAVADAVNVDESPALLETPPVVEYPAITPVSELITPSAEQVESPVTVPDLPVHTVLTPEASAEGAVAETREPFVEVQGITATAPGGAKVGLQFWLWFALGGSLASLSIGGASLYGFGVSTRQALITVLIGVLFSVIPISMAAVFGKYGVPAMVTSRAILGVVGNIPLSIVAALLRIGWFLLLIVFAAWIFADGSHALGLLPFDSEVVFISALTLFTLLAGVIFILGYRAVIWGISVAALVMLIGFIVLIAQTWSMLDFGSTVAVTEASWLAIVSLAIGLFINIGVQLAPSITDLGRHRSSKSGGNGVIAVVFALSVSILIFVGYSILLGPALADVAPTTLHPSVTLLTLVPSWAGVSILLAIVVGIIALALVSGYSANLAILSSGLRLRQPIAAMLLTAVLLTVGLTLVITVPIDLSVPMVTMAIALLSVPIATWIGMQAAQFILRRQALDVSSLLYHKGVYGSVNWLNLGIWIISIAIGTIFMGRMLYIGEVTNFGWSLFPGIDPALTQSGIGILIALALGFVLTLVSNNGMIRKQEEAAQELRAQSHWLG